jgi:predicted nucleic acid-binding protein
LLIIFHKIIPSFLIFIKKGVFLELKFCSKCTAIVDDRAVRRCSNSLSMITMGTGGLLILAKRRGLISSISPGIQALRDAGLWLSDSIVNILKSQAGE